MTPPFIQPAKRCKFCEGLITAPRATRFCSTKCRTFYLDNMAKLGRSTMQKECRLCDKPRDPSRRLSPYCSDICRLEARRESWRRYQRKKNKSTLDPKAPKLTQAERLRLINELLIARGKRRAERVVKLQRFRPKVS